MESIKDRDRKIQYLVVLCVSIGTMTLGATSAWLSPAMVKFHKNETDFEVTKEDVSWMASLNNPGFILGSLASRYAMVTFGRRPTLTGSSLPFTVGAIIIAFGKKAWLLCAARFLWGCGTGMISTVIGIYVAEISDKEIRGRLTIGTKLMTNLGNLFSMGVCPYVSYNVMNYLLLIMPIAQLLACLWIPESPYYLLQKGNVKLAGRELARLRGYKDEVALQTELAGLESSVNNEMRRSTSFWEFITGKQYRTAVIIAIGLKITQIMTGSSTVKQYLSRIVDKKAGMDVSTVLLAFGIIEFVVSFVTSLFADRVGRRPLLIYSFVGTALSLGVVAVYFLLQEIVGLPEETLAPYGVVTFIGILLANVISALGFNSILFAIFAEIFPINVKAVAMSSLSILGGILGFIVSKGFQLVIDNGGFFAAFAIFTSIAFMGAVFVYFLVPEMKGKSLKEVQIILQGDLYEDGEEAAAMNVANGEVRNGKVKEAELSEESRL